MNPEESQKKINWIFQQNHVKDPFREENVVFENIEEPEQNQSQQIEPDPGHYNLHVSAPTPPQEIHRQEPEPAPKPVLETQEPAETEDKKPRTFKDAFQDAFRQIVASAVFLLIGFIVLNWGAISKIVVHEWNKFTGAYENSPLQELIVDQSAETSSSSGEVTQKAQTTLDVNGDIPALNLEIAPSDNRIIIPDINQNVPIVGVSSKSLIERDWQALEQEMQAALQNGVVHYPGTSLPGQTGNVVVTGHSSYFPWDPGRFKDVFALLHDIELEDQIVIYYNQEKYVYVVSDIKVVLPEDIAVLKQTPNDQLTLITCTPVGTNLKRLIVTAIPLEDYQAQNSN